MANPSAPSTVTTMFVTATCPLFWKVKSRLNLDPAATESPPYAKLVMMMLGTGPASGVAPPSLPCAAPPASVPSTAYAWRGRETTVSVSASEDSNATMMAMVRRVRCFIGLLLACLGWMVWMMRMMRMGGEEGIRHRGAGRR